MQLCDQSVFLLLVYTIEKTYVIPYLIDLAPSDILPGPLTQFQAKRANKSETWELVRTLNGKLDNPLADEQLRRGFERCWNELETSLKGLPEATSHQEVMRSQGDMLAEVLELVRAISRSSWTRSMEHLKLPTPISLDALQQMLEHILIELNNPISQEHKEFFEMQLRILIGNLLLYGQKSQEAQNLLRIAQEPLLRKK